LTECCQSNNLTISIGRSADSLLCHIAEVPRQISSRASPGSPSAKRGCGIAFNEHGGPHPHAPSGLAAFSGFRWHSRVYGLAREPISRATSRMHHVEHVSERNDVDHADCSRTQTLRVKGTHRLQREAVRRPPSRHRLTAREACGPRARTKGEVGVLASRVPSRHRSAVRRRSFGFALQ
jgi:hypothetical protein